MKSILYILYDGLTEPLGQSQVLSYLKVLASDEYVFTVISCEKYDKYKQHGDRIREICDEYNIEWHPLIYHKSPPILSTIYDIYNIRKKADLLFEKQTFDAVHCRSYIAAFVGSYLKKRYGCRFIFDIRGFYADERVDGNIWNLGNPIYKAVYNFFKKKESKWFVEADHIISLTHTAADYIQRSYQADNITVIPCCVNTADFNYIEVTSDLKNETRESLGFSKDDFILIYHGSIGTWYLLNEMLEFFKVMKEKIPSAKLFFLSKEKVENIHSTAKGIGLDVKDIVVRSVPFHDVPKHLSVANASVFFIKPVFSKQASSPTKLAELLSMGIPVFTNSGVGDVDSIVDECRAGSLIRNFNEEAYSAAIDKFLSEGPINKEQLHLYTRRNFDSEVGAKRYRAIYEEMFTPLETNQILIQ